MNNEPLTIKYKPVIGLEVHVELKTKSKMFCGCSAYYFGEKPNTHTCPVCLGLPGALPVPNKKAIEWCIKIGLALNCKIANISKFDRKNYFYPDLAKGYQISQYDKPFATNGKVVIARSTTTKQSQTEKIAALTPFARNDSKVIRIIRVHMEEDTGKLIHQGDSTLIDFNRSGVPLVEIVTEPDFENAVQVKEYLQKLQQIVRYLDVSNADMEKGEMRLEPNISLKPVILASKASMTNDLPPYKVEVKNINSFRFVEDAINFEIQRQTEILDSGKTPLQETRGWDSVKKIAVSQRIKEEAMDYRYFPEPDIPPFQFDESYIAGINCDLPELPEEKKYRFTTIHALSEYDAEILTRDRETADYFEEALRASAGTSSINYQVSGKNIANYIINKKVDINKTLPAELVKIIIKSSQKPSIDKDKLEEIIKKVISENSKAVNDYKSGKIQVIGFLIGKVKQHFSTADTNQIRISLEKHLKS